MKRHIAWIIEKKGGGMTIITNSSTALFNYISEQENEETAIEVGGWAELAAVGEIFETNKLTIEVAEE